MKKEILKTSDGSNTLFVPELNETYHSTHGALQESMHVFVKEGMRFLSKKNSISVLEVGFGTGLNAILTAIEAEKENKIVEMTSLEAFPLILQDVRELGYTKLDAVKTHATLFEQMHEVDWGKFMSLSSNFKLKKLAQKLQEFKTQDEFDLIYFDAFAPDKQPELWTEEVFLSMYKALKSEGVLVTYCAKGTVKRALKSVGFILQSIPGPPGKREMSRGVKKK